MRFILLVILVNFSGSSLYAAALPSLPFTEKKPVKTHSFTLKDVSRIKGRKMTFKEKMQFILLQYQLKKLPRKAISSRQNRQATVSMIFGILSLVLLFTPAAVVAIPAAIVGLVFGIVSVKGNSNTKSIVGIITSGVTISVLILAFLLVSAFYY